MIRFSYGVRKNRLPDASPRARRPRLFLSIAAVVLGAGMLFGQSIMNKTIVGNVFTFTCSVGSPIDTVANRLCSIDSLAKIMGCVCRKEASARFERVGGRGAYGGGYRQPAGRLRDGSDDLAQRAGAAAVYLSVNEKRSFFSGQLRIVRVEGINDGHKLYTALSSRRRAFSGATFGQITLIEGNEARLEKMMEAR